MMMMMMIMMMMMMTFTYDFDRKSTLLVYVSIGCSVGLFEIF